MKRAIWALLALLGVSYALAATTTSNMSLLIPDTGDTDYPTSISSSFTLIDAHDHTTGKGVQIPAGGIASNAVTAVKIAAAVAGTGLSGGGGSNLSVNVDNVGIEVDTDTLRLKDSGVVTAKIADLNVTTGKINDLGVTTGKLAALAVTAAKIALATITGAQVADNINLPGNTVQENARNVIVSSTNATLSLAMIRGRVSAAASITAGEGFSVAHPSTGTYDITYTQAFSDAAVVTAVAGSTAGSVYTRVPVGNSTTSRIQIFDITETAMDAEFYFSAIGQR